MPAGWLSVRHGWVLCRSAGPTLVTFAERIGADLVAEGIETDRERIALLRLGIHRGQGFRLGRPVPVTALSAPDTVLD
jgi:EAL domain-containing protein (putative c-di-GMP-specific phosphodiesterase class I)